MINSDNPKSDTIEVREDERFDVDKLQKHLAGKLPKVDDDTELNVRQFWGGAANLTYLLDYGEIEYVLRRPPLGKVAKSAHDMSREYQALSVLYQEFPYAPRAYYYEDNPEIIGSDFFIMERKRGVVIRKNMPEVFDSIPNAAEQASKALVDTLVEFHNVDYMNLGLEDLGRPEGFIGRQIEGWYRRWTKAAQEENAQMDAVYEWLKENQPVSQEPTLVHNDYKLDNVMYAKDDPSQLKAVFDWDMCTLGDPLSDLGAMLTYWYQPDDPPYLKNIAMMPTEDVGFLTREQLIIRYAEKSGRSMENINFYHALGLFRLVVIIAQIYIRYVKGQTEDQRFANLDQLIPFVIQAANEVAHGTFKK